MHYWPAQQWLCRSLLFLALLPAFCPAALKAAALPMGVPGSRYVPTVIDLDLPTGKVVASGPDQVTASAPGSTLKPFVLRTAMELGVVTPKTRLICRGSLYLAGRNLACAHPASLNVFAAQEALAYSCNNYFAQVARQLPPAALQRGLQQFGFEARKGTGSPEQRVLLVLGLDGIMVTPVQLAHAYAGLARTLGLSDAADKVIRAGLFDSVAYGMAHAAQTPNLVVCGKTGTAHDAAPMLQHGWFAGFVSAPGDGSQATHILVVYAPGGNGNDAALAAHRYLQSRRW